MSKLVLLLLTIINVVIGYNYLIYCPLFATSHSNVIANIADTLTVAGHNVTIFAPVMSHLHKGKLPVKFTKDIVTVDVTKEVDDAYTAHVNGPIGDLWTIPAGAHKDAMISFKALVSKHCVDLGKDNEWKKNLKSRHFDVYLYEPMMFCGSLIRKLLGIKTVIATPTLPFEEPTLRAIGEPFAPSITPVVFSTYGDRMNLKERFLNAKEYFSSEELSLGPVSDEAFKTFGIEKFDIVKALEEVTFVFIQSNTYIDFPRATLPKTILIGGIATNMTKIRSLTLPKEFDELLNKRKKTVLLSFGSVVQAKAMPRANKDNIVAVIRSFPEVTFLWKYEDDDVSFADGIDNVHFAKWFPQTALLADPRLSAMITHAGLGSTMEIAHCGVPVITVPIFGDQMRNGKMLERHGGSINLNKLDLPNYDVLRRAVKDILYENRFDFEK